MTPPIGHRLRCKACQRDIVRIAINAPYGPDYVHVDGPCQPRRKT